MNMKNRGYVNCDTVKLNNDLTPSSAQTLCRKLLPSLFYIVFS